MYLSDHNYFTRGVLANSPHQNSVAHPFVEVDSLNPIAIDIAGHHGIAMRKRQGLDETMYQEGWRTIVQFN